MKLVPQRLVGAFFGVGSVQAEDPAAPLHYITDLQLPYWYQLPSFGEEDMVRQFAYLIDGYEEEGDFILDVDMYTYREILEDDSPLLPDERHARGLHLLRSKGPFLDFKTQQTAPATMAFSIRGPDGGQLLSKSMVLFFSSLMKRIGMGQVEFLSKTCENLLLCQDDPALGHVIDMIQNNRVSLDIREIRRLTEGVYPEGVIPAYHYCDDWRNLAISGEHLLWDTKPKLVHIDVLRYPPNLETGQSEAINQFIERGGGLALGVLPNNDDDFTGSVTDVLRGGLERTIGAFGKSGVSIELLQENAMISTQCGLSHLSSALTERLHIESHKFPTIFKEMTTAFLTR
ncbi:hypothetical protein EU546_03530 [Candidatus Thorarchaeota archaeon]|nr:MAG: hypothetical protein EU546_03530 [Candidatus Thorarchaeota archaeon]